MALQPILHWQINSEKRKCKWGKRNESKIWQITKITIKMFRYRDTRSSSYCKLPKPNGSWKTIKNTQKTESFCFFWRSFAHKNKTDNHHDRVLHYAKQFHQLSHLDVRLSIKIKDIPSFEQMKKLKTVFLICHHPLMRTAWVMQTLKVTLALSSLTAPKIFNQKINISHYEERIDLLFYGNKLWLMTYIHKLVGITKTMNNFIKRSLNTSGDQTKLEEHMLRCF